MIIEKPLIIKCDNCDEIIEVDIDMECVGEYERQMGAEYEYEGIIEDDCPKCGNLLYVKISAWEYPVGALNYEDIKVEGAEIMRKPSLSLYD